MKISSSIATFASLSDRFTKDSKTSKIEKRLLNGLIVDFFGICLCPPHITREITFAQR